MWDKRFNIVIYCLPPLYLVTKAICPLCANRPFKQGDVTVSWVPSLRPCMEPSAPSSQPLVEPREGSEQPFWSWEPTAFDRDPQPLITPSNCGLLPTTPSRRPGTVTPLSSCFIADAEDMLSSLPPSTSWKFGQAWSSS